MSKTNKRQTRRSVPAMAASTTLSKSAASKPAASSRAAEREFNPDYTPVIKDLKRIGTLAGTFIALLVVLSFFLK